MLPGESAQEFEKLEERLIKDFSCEDIVGISLVHDLAVLLWKKMRFSDIENRVQIGHLEKPITVQELKTHLKIPVLEKAILVINHLDGLDATDVAKYRDASVIARGLIVEVWVTRSF